VARFVPKAIPGRVKERMRSSIREGLAKAGDKGKELLDRYYNSVPPYRLTRSDRLVALLLFLFFFALYLFTCSHNPNMAGDSPELISASYSLGVAHPPGYPTYTMLGYLITRLPLGSVAFRMNFLSVLFHSLALLLLFPAFLKMTRSLVSSAVATSILGFSYLFWFYSLVAEVFPFNDFFAALLLLVAVMVRERWVDGNHKGSRRLFLLMTFLCGLSLTNHQTILFIFPALLLFTVYPLVSVLRRPGYLFSAIGLFLLGLVPYIYLPIAASRNPYMNFGDPSTPGRFLDVITRDYYGTTKLWRGPAATNRLDLVLDFLKTLGKEVYLPGMVLGVIGLFHAARKRLGDFLPLITTFFLTAVIFPVMANVKLRGVFDTATIERFYLLPTLIFTFFIAFGISAVIHWLKDLLSRLKAREDLRRGFLWVLILLIALPFLLPAWSTSAKVNLKYDELGTAYIHNLVSSVEEGSVIFVQGDVPIQLMDYYKTAFEDQKDLIILSYSFLLNPWYIDTVHEWYPDLNLPNKEEIPEGTDARASTFKAWLINYLMANNPQIPGFHILTKLPELEKTNHLLPWGVTYKVLPQGSDLDLEEYYQSQLAYWRDFNCAGMDISFYGDNRREQDFVALISYHPSQAGAFLAANMNPAKAVYFYKIAYNLLPAPEYLKILADLYLALGRPDIARAYLTDYINSMPIYSPDTWQAILDMEESYLLQGGGDER